MKTELFKLLSCHTRFEIMNMLIVNEHVCVCHLEEKLGLSQANASKHLKLFRDLNVVDTEKIGKSVFYQLNDKFKAEHKLLLEYVNKGENYEKDCCLC